MAFHNSIAWENSVYSAIMCFFFHMLGIHLFSDEEAKLLSFRIFCSHFSGTKIFTGWPKFCTI
jgi:hypothetical protein